MARQDFAHQRRNGANARPAASRKSPRPAAPKRPAPPPRRTPWVLLITTLLVIGGLGYLVYTLLQTPPQPTATAPAAPAPRPAPSAPAAPAAAETPRSSRFEFYEMLPRSEVVAPKVEAYQSTPKDAKMEHRYLLQAGSFRDPADAERMRARLILEGFPGVRTDRSDGSNGVWYRVRIGPFDNKTDMNRAHNKLGKLNIIPMPIRID